MYNLLQHRTLGINAESVRKNTRRRIKNKFYGYLEKSHKVNFGHVSPDSSKNVSSVCIVSLFITVTSFNLGITSASNYFIMQNSTRTEQFQRNGNNQKFF